MPSPSLTGLENCSRSQYQMGSRPEGKTTLLYLPGAVQGRKSGNLVSSS